MKSILRNSCLAVALTLGCTYAMAQEAIKEDFKPSSLNQPGKEYPMVNSQGYARFRVEAPDAKSVVVSLGLGGSGGTVLQNVHRRSPHALLIHTFHTHRPLCFLWCCMYMMETCQEMYDAGYKFVSDTIKNDRFDSFFIEDGKLRPKLKYN